MNYVSMLLETLFVLGLALLAGAYILLAEVVSESLAALTFDDAELREQLATAINLLLVGGLAVGLYIYFA